MITPRPRATRALAPWLAACLALAAPACYLSERPRRESPAQPPPGDAGGRAPAAGAPAPDPTAGARGPDPEACARAARFEFGAEHVPVPADTVFDARALASADLDGDGRDELAVSTFGGQAIVFTRRDGWTEIARAELGVSPALLVAADLDGDGLLDLAAAAGEEPRLAIAYGLPDLRFDRPSDVALPAVASSVQPLQLGTARAASLAVAAGSDAADDRPSGLWVLPQDTFGDARALPGAADLGAAPRLSTGDVDGNGLPDLVSGGAFFLQHPDGAFTRHLIALDVPPARAAALADLDGDSRTDVALVGSDAVDIYYNRGTRGFEHGLSESLTYPTDIAAGTVDCDTLSDLITLSSGEGMALFTGARGGVSRQPATPDTPLANPLAGLRPGDFDGNGQLDVAQPGYGECLSSDDCTHHVVVLMARGR